MSVGSVPVFTQAGIFTLAASTTSAGVELLAVGDTLLVTNGTASTAWIAVGGGAVPPVAAVGSGHPVLAGQRRLIGINYSIGQVAAVLSTGTGNVFVEVGTGSAT